MDQSSPIDYNLPLKAPEMKDETDLNKKKELYKPKGRLKKITSKEEWNALTPEERKYRNYLKRQKHKNRKRLKKKL